MNKGFSYRNKGFIFANKSFILRFHRHKRHFAQTRDTLCIGTEDGFPFSPCKEVSILTSDSKSETLALFIVISSNEFPFLLLNYDINIDDLTAGSW